MENIKFIKDTEFTLVVFFLCNMHIVKWLQEENACKAMPFTWVGTTADMMNTDILQLILISHLMSCYGKEIHQQFERQELSTVQWSGLESWNISMNRIFFLVLWKLIRLSSLCLEHQHLQNIHSPNECLVIWQKLNGREQIWCLYQDKSLIFDVILQCFVYANYLLCNSDIHKEGAMTDIRLGHILELVWP